MDGKALVISGLTGDQRFFLASVQARRAKLREGAARERLLTDPHFLPVYRVNGIVRDVDAWYTTFGMKAGDALYFAPALPGAYLVNLKGAASLRALFGHWEG